MTETGQVRPRAHRFLTTKMVLALGLGVLLTLLVLSGGNAVRVVSTLQRSNENILGEFLGHEARLDELRAAIYLSGTYVRDYLLEPDPAKAEQSRMALDDTRRQIVSMIPFAISQPDSEAIYGALRRELNEYLRTLDPVLTWNAPQRHQQGYGFLRDDVLPRRSSTLAITDTIASLNQQQLLERDHRLFQIFSGFRNRLIVAVTVMFLCGLALAFATAFHIIRLENQTMAHLNEVTNARQELRSLSASLVESQENERKNISRELHDAVGQSMSAVQFELHNLGIALAGYPEPLRSHVHRIRELVEHSVEMVRNMALLLRPSMLDDLGLLAALQWQANQVSRLTGIRIMIAADELPDDLPEDHKISVFRIVQEALNNVCKHARASSVEIAVHSTDGRISVMIKDDGRGFKTPRSAGLGLVGMQERAEGLGGMLAVDSRPGQGTTIELSLPLPEHATVGRATSPPIG